MGNINAEVRMTWLAVLVRLSSPVLGLPTSQGVIATKGSFQTLQYAKATHVNLHAQLIIWVYGE